MKYTKTELRAFDALTNRLSSRDQMTRIKARLDLKEFLKEHGQEKCDAMFEEIKRKEGR